MTKVIVYMIAAGFTAFAVEAASAATVVRSPVANILNTGGQADSGSGIEHAIDRSGLATPFVSGVTDWNTYFGTQSHTQNYFGFEWFSAVNVTSVTLIFDMGAQYSIDKMALWNEEVSGLSHVDVFTSNDPLFGTSTAVGSFNPINNPLNADYTQEIFSLVTTNARYIKLNATGAPDERFPAESWTSIGELAFSTAAPAAVPVPASLPAGLICISMLAVGQFWRCRRQAR